MFRSLSKKTVAIAAVAIVGLGITSCSSSPGEPTNDDSLETMDPIVLVTSDIRPSNTPIGAVFESYLDEIEERTNGKVTFDRYSAGALLQATEALDGAGDGIADVAQLSEPLYPDRLPIMNWTLQLGSLRDPSYLVGFLADYLTMLEVYQQDPAVVAELAEEGVRPLLALASLPPSIFCVDPVDETPPFLDGRRTRTSGVLWADEASALGMTSVAVGQGEQFEALQRSVIDCNMQDTNVGRDLGFLEVTNHLILAATSPLTTGYVINLDTWNSLPPEVQDIFNEAAIGYYEGYLKETLAGMKAVIADANSHDVELVDPTPINALLSEHQERVREAALSNAPSGIDADSYLERRQEALDRWGEFLVTEFPELAGEPDSLGEKIEWAADLDLSFMAEPLARATGADAH